jgi:hypothetical protein
MVEKRILPGLLRNGTPNDQSSQRNLKIGAMTVELIQKIGQVCSRRKWIDAGCYALSDSLPLFVLYRYVAIDGAVLREFL